jgi:hypothetical protein
MGEEMPAFVSGSAQKELRPCQPAAVTDAGLRASILSRHETSNREKK